MRRGSLLASVAAAALTGCSVTATLPPAPQIASPLAVDYSSPSYQLQVGDIIDVRLMLNPELNEEVTIRPDGHLSTTVVPDIIAAGRTVPDLTNSLRQAYSKDLKNPRLSILLKSFSPTRIYVAGEVNSPGEFVDVGPNLTLSQAIARAGGIKLSADDTSVFIIRKTSTATPELLSARYSKILHAGDATADITLSPYDVVFVPKTGIAEVYAFYNQYIEQFAHPSIGFSYLINPGGTTSVVPNTTGTTVAPATTVAR